VDIVGALKRAPNGEALLRIPGSNHSIVFYVELFLRARGVFGFDDVVCVLPDGIDIAFFDQIGLEDIVCAPDDLLRGLTFFHGEERGERFVFDGYGIDGFWEEMAVGMREQENRLFGMIDDSIREAGLIVFDERDAILAGDVRGRDDYEFVPIDSRPEGELFDFAAWNAAADGGAVEHAA
jgi:hypothetical protein